MRTIAAVVLSTAFAIGVVTMAHGQAAPPVDKSAAVEMRPDIRAGYAEHLRRAFLKSGLDYSVFSKEKRDPSRQLGSTNYPMLLIWGWINDPDIYWFITKTGILKSAKEYGFVAVDFVSKGSKGHWIFDVSGADLPSCDVQRRVCR